MNKKFLVAILFYALLVKVSSAIADEPPEWHLFSFIHGAETAPDVWVISSSRLHTLPKWNPATEPAPFALEKACKLGAQWVKAKNDVTDATLERVEIFSVNPNSDAFKDIFIYKLIFKIGYVDQAVCFILMDGTVLEPIKGPPQK